MVPTCRESIRVPYETLSPDGLRQKTAWSHMVVGRSGTVYPSLLLSARARMNAPICASMFIDYAKDYMSQYSLSMTQPDRDVVSAEKDCAVLAARLI